MPDFDPPVIPTPNFSHVRWYVVRDDCLGGWAISNVNKPTSEHDPAAGDFTLADFLTEELTRYVAALHNHLHRSRFPDQWADEL